MTEDDLKRTVLDLCQHLGLLVAHFRPAQVGGRWITPVEADGKGFPDLVIAGAGGVLFRELKAEGKYPTAEQKVWLKRLGEAGQDAGVWRPRNLADGSIEQALKALKRVGDET